MKPTGYLVAFAAEFAPGVKYRENHLDGRLLELWVLVHWDASTVVGNADRVVGVDDYLCVSAVSREGLVHSVVHDFIHEVVKSPWARGPDIHARAFTNRLETLQYLDVFT